MNDPKHKQEGSDLTPNLGSRADLPAYFTPAQVAEHFKISERALRLQVRQLGCCRIIGKRIFLTEDDLQLLLDSWRPQPTAPISSSSNPSVVSMLSVQERARRHLEKRANSKKPEKSKRP